MNKEEKLNKRKLNMVSPTKGDPLTRIDLTGDNSSVKSGLSNMSTTLSSKDDKDEPLENKGQDADGVASSLADGTMGSVNQEDADDEGLSKLER